MALVLVLDLGTTLLKASLFDEGRLLTVVRRASPIPSAAPGRCEIDLLRFRQWIAGAVAELRSMVPDEMARIGAVTFATQTNSFVLLDAADRPLTPIILWPDARAIDDPSDIALFESLPQFHQVSGIPALSTEFAVTKLRWLRRHDPSSLSNARRFCLISDYLTLWLTGAHVTEAGTAGLTGLLDIHTLKWWDLACQCAGLSENMLPTVVRAGADLGPIRAAVATELGLPSECRLIVGCLDQYAGAIGAGCVRDRMVCESTGTVLATVRCLAATNGPTPPGVFEGPGFIPDVKFQMTFGSTSANLLDFFQSTLAHRPPLAALIEAAAAEPVGAGGVTIRPWQAGTPMEACFADVPPGTPPGRVVRAILEAVGRALQRQINSLAEPGSIDEVRCAGGGARSDAWLQIKADLVGVPMVASGCPEPTSLGSALLVAQTVDHASMSDLAQKWCVARQRFSPDPVRHAQYAAEADRHK